MTDKKVLSKNGTRIDKMGGVIKECFHDEVAFLVDERGYTGTTLLEEGIRAVSSRECIMNRCKTMAHVETTVSGESG